MQKTKTQKTITIPLQEYRRLKRQYRKLGSFLEEFERRAKKKLTEEQRKTAQKMIKMMEKGFDMGKLKYKHRSELYES